ncbi:MAG TPA: type IV pilus modification protein PilV [Pseudomonas sp.]|nr:type IV pilus modification protein PilV [Pseudomonas sp.]
MSCHANRQGGFSMIEVLVTLLVFTIGLLGLAALQLNALQGTADSAQRSQATAVLQDLAERIRANPQAGAASYAGEANCAALPATSCADHINPATGAKVNAGDCNAAQMAAFDRWEAQCSYAALAAFNAGDARFTSRDFLIPAAGANGRAVAIVNSNGVLSLTATWQSKGNEPQEAGKAERGEKLLSARLEEIRR